MARKASERWHVTDGVFENEPQLPQLFVLSRRPYKPRFRAAGAVVIVHGTASAPALTPVSASDSSSSGSSDSGSTRSSSAAGRTASGSGNGSAPHPCALFLPVAAALFAHTACEALFVADYSPLVREMPSELTTAGPGKVAKPVARLLAKLSPSQGSILAASGPAGCAVVLKLLPTLCDGVSAMVLEDAADVSPAALRAVSSSSRSAASGSGVPASVDVVVTLGAGAGEAAAGSEAMARAQAALATALPQA